MKFARIVLVTLIAVSASAGAVAQWKWRDRNGVIQYSDLPPPSGTPDKDVIERPAAAQRRPASLPPSESAASAAHAASAPRGVDPELEARRKKAEVEKAEKSNKEAIAKQAEEDRLAMVRADNCRRARASLRGLEEGVRMARTNDQGEREVLDDKMRAEEAARMRGIIASDCATGAR
jgi:hypothetical protein